VETNAKPDQVTVGVVELAHRGIYATTLLSRCDIRTASSDSIKVLPHGGLFCKMSANLGVRASSKLMSSVLHKARNLITYRKQSC
jgi:hypothetical protein